MAPHLLMSSRTGYKYGNFEALDHMQWDGLTNPYDSKAMGTCGDQCAAVHKVTREAQDEYALSSYTRSRQAIESGLFKSEIVPVEVKQKSQPLIVERDEEPFGVDLAKIKGLKPAFDPQGSVTAGNASSLSDGAALLVIMEEDLAIKKGLPILAKITGSATHSQKPEWFTTAPIRGIQKLLEKTGLRKDEIDLFEINEAFSLVPMIAMTQLGLDPQKVNTCGGAVSLGHPIGASGARILVTLIHALLRKGKGRGIGSICNGGGEACSLVLETGTHT